MLSAAEHSKLIRVLEMTRSDSDGEALAAARAAQRILAGRSFADVWPAPRIAYSPPPRSTFSRPARAPTWRERAAECRRCPGILSERENEFLRSLLQWTGDLTPKQAAWLARISAKVDQLAASGA